MNKSKYTLCPIVHNDLLVGDVVLCKVKGRYMCHEIGAVRGDFYRIQNHKGHVNGWTHRNQIYGKWNRT